LAPHPDYAVAEPLFGDVSVDTCDESFSFGKSGKPFLIQGPNDTPARTRKRIEAMRRTLGDGGFDYILGIDDDDDLLDDDDTDLADDVDAETDDAIESITGMRYDPEAAPDAEKWQELGEDEQIMLAEVYHRRAGIELPNTKVHAVMHVIIENQVALGDELPVRRAIERLMGEGLDRHEAVHAVGSVLAAHMSDTLKAGAANNAAYNAAVERLTELAGGVRTRDRGRPQLTAGQIAPGAGPPIYLPFVSGSDAPWPGSIPAWGRSGMGVVLQ